MHKYAPTDPRMNEAGLNIGSLLQGRQRQEILRGEKHLTAPIKSMRYWSKLLKQLRIFILFLQLSKMYCFHTCILKTSIF